MKEYIIKIGDEPDIMGNYPLTEKAKELVRCKDCKHFTQTKFDNDGFGHCHDWMGWKETTTDWFCADGERKDGDGECSLLSMPLGTNR